MIIESGFKKFSPLANVLYAYKDDPGFDIGDAMEFVHKNPEITWKLPRAPQQFDTRFCTVETTFTKDKR